MSLMKEIRSLLNLKQEELAQYLMVSPSVISMAESGQRDLPGQKWMKIIELQDAHKALQVKKEKGMAGVKTQIIAQDLDEREKRIFRIEGLKHNLIMMRSELAGMTESYEKAIDKSRLMENFRTDLLETEENKHEREWFNSQWSRSISEIRKCGPAMQASLRIKLELAEAEIEITQRIMKELLPEEG